MREVARALTSTLIAIAIVAVFGAFIAWDMFWWHDMAVWSAEGRSRLLLGTIVIDSSVFALLLVLRDA